MASIRKRKGAKGTSYDVSIRKRGHPPIYESFATRKDAEAFVARTEANITEGKHYGFARIRTLSDLIDAFEPEAKPIRSARDRKRALNWWRSHYGAMKLERFDTATGIKARRKLLTEPVKRHPNSKNEQMRPRSPQTARFYLGVASQVFDHGVNVLRWIERNPMVAVDKPPPSPGRVRWLQDDERTRLLDACTRSDNPDLHLIVLLALTSGARQGEIRNLRWSQVDLKQRVVWLAPDDTKTAKARAVPLVPSVVQALQERSKVRRIDTDLVFPSDVNRTKPRNFRQAFAVALKRAEVSGFRFHDCRHSAATEMLRAGVDSRVVAEVLGHRTLAMMLRYQHVAPEFVVAAADKAAARMGV